MLITVNPKKIVTKNPSTHKDDVYPTTEIDDRAVGVYLCLYTRVSTRAAFAMAQQQQQQQQQQQYL